MDTGHLEEGLAPGLYESFLLSAQGKGTERWPVRGGARGRMDPWMDVDGRLRGWCWALHPRGALQPQSVGLTARQGLSPSSSGHGPPSPPSPACEGPAPGAPTASPPEPWALGGALGPGRGVLRI